jgi:hypothetical protein
VFLCREALILVAVPMVASAASTVICTTPLFAAVTLILNRFAAVIFVTMVVGIIYVILFMVPMLAMFGPGPKKKVVMSEDTPLHVVVKDELLKSKGVRFVVTTVIAVLVLVRLCMHAWFAVWGCVLSCIEHRITSSCTLYCAVKCKRLQEAFICA